MNKLYIEDYFESLKKTDYLKNIIKEEFIKRLQIQYPKIDINKVDFFGITKDDFCVRIGNSINFNFFRFEFDYILSNINDFKKQTKEYDLSEYYIKVG